MKIRLDHFGILAPFYERFIPPDISEHLIKLIDLPSGGTVLDAAGGTGRVAQFLCENSAQVVVVDESLGMLREAGSKEGLRTACAHAEQMPFPCNQFDRILMVDALHHVADHQQTAEELWRVLRPGGRIVIEEPDVRSFGVKLMALAEKVTLMRSHFLAPEQIGMLFRLKCARVFVETDGPTAWVIIEKPNEPAEID